MNNAVVGLNIVDVNIFEHKHIRTYDHRIYKTKHSSCHDIFLHDIGLECFYVVASLMYAAMYIHSQILTSVATYYFKQNLVFINT